MKNFMIGQYGSFNYKKFKRDFKEGFYGIEACLFEDNEDVTQLVKESKDKGFKIGVHFPIRPDKTKLRDPLFLAQDKYVRKDAFDYIQKELEYLSYVEPEYILFHYPKPVILDDNVNWELWRFAEASEYVYESSYSFEELKEKSEYLFQWLSEKCRVFHFTPVLEFDALNKYIYETDFLDELLNKYTNVKLCLDTGRLHLQDKLDPNFHAIEVIKKYAKYADIIHLSSVKVNGDIEYFHYPALPNLSANEGWAPIEDYMKIIRRENSNVKIMFEHRSDLISAEELEKCYLWIDKLLNK